MAGLQGRVLGGYQLNDLIGSGGIAEVYRGRPVGGGGREAAIKIIYPEFARQPGFLPNFRRIVDMSARLSNHPHILPLLASGEDNGYLYLATPYVSGGTLREWLLQGGRLGATDVAPFFRQLCGAVAYAHSLGITHGNLKPSNIFLFEGRHVLLGDFGLLWDVRHMDMNHVGSGTEAVEFLAPEAFQGQSTQASDIYGIGAVLFATLIGHPPFSGLKPGDIYAAHTQQPVPHLAQVDGSLSAGVRALDPIIQRAMAKRPDDRFPGAMQVAQAIETALQQAPGALVPAPTPQQPWQMGMQPNMPMGYPETTAPMGPSPYGQGMPVMGPGMGPGMTAMPAPPSVPLMPLGFPALGDNEHADGQMELGRPDFPMGQSGGLLTEPTARMPAPRTIGEASSIGGGTPDMATLHVPAPDGNGWPPTPYGAPPGPAGSGPRPFEMPGGPEAAMRLPAIRMGSGPTGQGDGSYDPTGGAFAWQSPGGATMEGTGEYPAGGFTEGSIEVPAASSAYSATELGLPRLTMPELPDMPQQDWQQAAAPSQYGGASQYGGPSSYYDDGYSREYAAAPNSRWEDSRAYPATGEWSQAGESAQYSAAYPTYEQDRRGGARSERGRYDPRGDDSREMASFTEQRVWTNGGTARRARRKRRVRNIVVSLVLLLALLGGATVIYARPEICPVSACQSLSTLAHKYVPSIGSLGAAPLPFATDPASAKLSVVTGKVATGAVKVSNPSTQQQAWRATVDTSWLSVSPAAGTLGPGATTSLTITAKPVGITPGTYQAQMTVMDGEAVTHVAVSVVVSVGARLNVAPTALKFTNCGVEQTVTVKNTGDAALTYTATPSVSAALSVSASKLSLAPGASATLTATLHCQAAWGQDYTINVVSNGGNNSVLVHYGV